VAPDHASRDRTAALRVRSAPASPSPASAPSASPPVDAATRPVESGPAEQPDPEFWGSEPRRVRQTRREPVDEPRWAPGGWTAALDRIRDVRVDVGVGVVAVVLVALVAGVVWYRMGVAGGGAPLEAPRSAAPSGAAGEPGSTVERSAPTPLPAGATSVTVTTSAAAAAHKGATVVVHVAGAVVRPGVLLMPEGARVIDAVEGAGGATPEADLDRLNLAARLVDGQRVMVVKAGAPAVADPGAAAGPVADPGALIDLNSATNAQLESLPGIGPALAGAIIAERDRRGGFRSINELREVRGIGEARFADLRARVTV